MKHQTCSECGYSLMKNGNCSNERCENSPHPEEGISLADLEKLYPSHGLFNGRKWGNWHLDAKRLCLVHPDYEIDLEDISDSARMLDWIFQIEAKAWATDKDIADLVSAIQTIFDPQASLCSGGISKTIEPSKFLLKRIKLTKGPKSGHRHGAT